MADRRTEAWDRFRGGVTVGLPLVAPTFLLAVTFGALARGTGWGMLAPIVCSLVVFSGSAQFTLATVLGGGSGAALAVAAAALINARFLPMGVAVAPSLHGGRLRRAWEGQAVVDASWVAAHVGDGRYDRERLLGATAVQWPAWVLGTVVGVLLAPSTRFVDTFGLDVLFPAFFLILLMDELKQSPTARKVAAAGAVIAGGLTVVVPAGLALLASAGATALGMRGAKREATS